MLGTALTPTPGTARFRFAFSVATVPDALLGFGDVDDDGIRDSLDACPELPGVSSPDLAMNGCPPDQDRDGIWDRDDACKSVPGVPHADTHRNGCPPDRDGDGITDAVDACVNVFGVAHVDPRRNGCPSDRDDDSIVDREDACPDVPGIRSDDPKRNGCPPDRDSDGIIDDEDACIDVAGVRSDDPKRNGCPPDTDGDGILDEVDACVDEPGPPNQDPKKHGCPLAVVKGEQIRISEKVHFELNKAVIRPESDTLLEAVAKVLREHPELELVTIEGHTDSRGWPALNKRLSNDRARAVRTWLVTRGGIEPARLESVGVGADRPIADNATEEGQAQNRRVEFHIKKRRSSEPAPK
jgi:outer membrane protein OmpA-like peptidoglycan-associated protein